MLWHKVERAAQCADAGFDGQDRHYRFFGAKQNLDSKRKREFTHLSSEKARPKVIYTHNSLEFCEACEDFLRNHCTFTPRQSETSGTAERAVRRVEEGTSAVLLQSGLDEKWWAGQCCVTVFFELIGTSWQMGNLFLHGASENQLVGQSCPL